MLQLILEIQDLNEALLRPENSLKHTLDLHVHIIIIIH